MPPLAEITQLIVFGVLATAVVVGALGVVMLPNIVYSAFLLGGVFLSVAGLYLICLLYTSPSPRDLSTSRMPSSA